MNDSNKNKVTDKKTDNFREKIKLFLHTTKGKIILGICVAALLCIIGLVIGLLLHGKGNSGSGNGGTTATQAPTPTPVPTATPAAVTVSNPIDFTALWEKNKDVYAYIYIPNTRVDYPVLQHPTSNSYYLDYNMDGSKGLPGCIYTEIQNNKNFLDPNTVVYGHNMKNGSMFKTLHSFENEDFFRGNRYFYIYTPDRVLQYWIFAAYTYTDDRILYWYNFGDKAIYQQYLDMVQERGAKKGFLDNTVPVTTDSKIVTMSTCTGNDTTRWLVQGTLIQDIPCAAGATTTVKVTSENAINLAGAK